MKKPCSYMPCGECDVGIYSFEAANTPLAHKLRTSPSVARKPPRCKQRNRPCAGAVDFIYAITTPDGQASEPGGDDHE